jgi:hypothetical protein
MTVDDEMDYEAESDFFDDEDEKEENGGVAKCLKEWSKKNMKRLGGLRRDRRCSMTSDAKIEIEVRCQASVPNQSD